MSRCRCLEVLPPLGEEVKIYTHLQVREDDMSLYGFLSRSDLEMFRQLLGVNGIGPKGHLASCRRCVRRICVLRL
ncbi:MAG: OB-fold domain-containing protein [Clostridium fessum]